MTALEMSSMRDLDNPPEGYKKLPDGVRCRCIRLYSGLDGSHWCCNGPVTNYSNIKSQMENSAILVLLMRRLGINRLDITQLEIASLNSARVRRDDNMTNGNITFTLVD